MPRRLPTVVAGVLVVGLSLACGSFTESADPGVEPETHASMEAKLGAIAREIDGDPEGRGRILEAHGMSEADYEADLFDIALDPKRTRTYLEARGTD